MKIRIAILVSFFSLSVEASSEINIQVVYPRANQQIAAVDSEFIFGSVTPGSSLTINGQDVRIHKGGGWLAFLPVTPGGFLFRLVASKENDTSYFELPVTIGVADTVSGLRFIPKEILPSSKAVYSIGDILEFSFEAPSGGTAWFGLDERPLIIMYESEGETDWDGSVFGRKITAAEDADIARYVGYYHFTQSDTGIHRICYQYTNPKQSAVENRVVFKDCKDTLVTVLPHLPWKAGVLSGESQIVRTAPGKGYKLLYQPPGVMVNITGLVDSFYRIRLADGISGYVNVDSVTILPAGTAMPKGEISYIAVDKTQGGIRISMNVGARLPYEISESLTPSSIDVDIFGVTSDVDWIRYNTDDSLVKLVRWSQPQDGVFKMTVEVAADSIWGYKSYYVGNDFNLQLNGSSVRKGTHLKRLKGLRIAIDPGHSHDAGAIGPTGLNEKDANLWIAYELRQMLERDGAEVMMTRYGHENVPLYDRPRKAEKWGADLLISIHNNALPDGINPFANNGTSVYYYHPHSKALAEAIHKRMVPATGLPDHGLYYGNLVLTRYSAAPAVLVECAFMMIPEQEALLKTDKFQRKCARAIRDGIIDFVRGKR